MTHGIHIPLLGERPGCPRGDCDGLETLGYQFDSYRATLVDLLKTHEDAICERIQDMLHEQSDRQSVVTVNVETARRRSEFAARRKGWQEAALALGALVGAAYGAWQMFHP